MMISSTMAIADHWELDVSFYDTYSAADKMRKETIFVVNDQGQKRRVAERIVHNASNEVREIWTAEQGLSGANNNPENVAIWNSLSRNVTAAPSVRGSQLNDCTMSDDQLSISCPSGLYVKSSSVNDSLRNPSAKESPSAGSPRTSPSRTSPSPVSEE